MLINMKEDIEQKIREYLSKTAEIPAAELDADTMLSEYGITSLQFMECVAEIENIFDIHFSERDLNDIYTIDDFVIKVEKKINERT